MKIGEIVGRKKLVEMKFSWFQEKETRKNRIILCEIWRYNNVERHYYTKKGLAKEIAYVSKNK